jgi:hypothetical protein
MFEETLPIGYAVIYGVFGLGLWSVLAPCVMFVVREINGKIEYNRQMKQAEKNRKWQVEQHEAQIKASTQRRLRDLETNVGKFHTWDSVVSLVESRLKFASEDVKSLVEGQYRDACRPAILKVLDVAKRIPQEKWTFGGSDIHAAASVKGDDGRVHELHIAMVNWQGPTPDVKIYQRIGNTSWNTIPLWQVEKHLFFLQLTRTLIAMPNCPPESFLANATYSINLIHTDFIAKDAASQASV